MNEFRLAVAFLTRIPMGDSPATPAMHGASTRYYPLVGALLAIITLMGLFVGSWAFDRFAGCIIAVATLAAFTGALHLDGLSDCIDGLAVNGNAAKRLAAMKDPRAGGVGVAAMSLWLLLKVALLARCVDAGTVAQAVWCALIFARAPIPFELREGEPATPGSGLFAVLHTEVSRHDWIIALLFGLAFFAPALAPLGDIFARAAIGIIGGVVATGAWHVLWYRRIGGLNGDVVGAAVEIREMAMLAAMGVHLPF